MKRKWVGTLVLNVTSQEATKFARFMKLFCLTESNALRKALKEALVAAGLDQQDSDAFVYRRLGRPTDPNSKRSKKLAAKEKS